MDKRALSGLVGGVALMGVAFGCERAAPTAPSATSTVAGLSAHANGSSEDDDGIVVRWFFPGDGAASALSATDAKITLTGEGTFEPDDEENDDVTGGGTWQTFPPGSTTASASGTYRVKAFLSFQLAPGSIAVPSARAGLAFLRIRYSDGTTGILVISCRFPNTPAGVAEGISVSKGFVDFWKIQDPDFTQFRIVDEDPDD